MAQSWLLVQRHADLICKRCEFAFAVFVGLCLLGSCAMFVGRRHFTVPLLKGLKGLGA